MAKTKEELEALKNNYIKLSTKLNELSQEELESVVGGFTPILNKDNKLGLYAQLLILQMNNDLKIDDK